MSHIKVSEWGAQVGVAACVILIPSGIVCLSEHNGVDTGVYAIIIGIVLLPFFADAEILGPLLKLFHIYYLSAAVCFVFSVYCYFMLPTMFGGVVLDVAGIMYFIGACRGEQRKINTRK